jgi:serine/threonine protein phosphatase PrpC
MEEITAEYATEALVPAAVLRVRPHVTVACKTDLGRVRENNEDKFEFFLPEDEATLASRGMAFVVCDGMGGHEAGQIASELACKTFLDVYFKHPAEDPNAAILAGIRAANRFVLDVARAVPSRRGMGTTLSGLILLQGEALVVQVGDSRVYRLRDGELSMLTRDHTWIEEALGSGMLTRDEAEVHPYKHVLTRAIGTEDSIQPDIARFEARAGDVYLLCSDGIINHVPDETIASILEGAGPSAACWRLVEKALVEGGSDNATVIVVRVDDLEPVAAGL